MTAEAVNVTLVICTVATRRGQLRDEWWLQSRQDGS
jgi:hypothetical protein